MTILVLRPEPGAEQTASAARALGLTAVKAPIFTIRSVAWDAPDAAAFDAIVLTSANAARHAGPALGRYTDLPCYAVGEATADAARAAGFTDIRTGPADAAALTDFMRSDGAGRTLHLAGADHVGGAASETRIVYASEAAEALPPAALDAIRDGALLLLHSPRAAAIFARLADVAGISRSTVALAAISPAAAAAAGEGWKAVTAADAPRDARLLALAARLCQKGGDEGEGR